MSYKCSKFRVQKGRTFCSHHHSCHRPLYSCSWVDYLYNQVAAGIITLNSIWPMSVRHAVKNLTNLSSPNPYISNIDSDGQLKLNF